MFAEGNFDYRSGKLPINDRFPQILFDIQPPTYFHQDHSSDTIIHALTTTADKNNNGGEGRRISVDWSTHYDGVQPMEYQPPTPLQQQQPQPDPSLIDDGYHHTADNQAPSD